MERFRNRPPIQILSVGFVVISLIGGLLLSLPISSSSHRMTPFLDALFTATSAVTTTGLIVVDTGSHFSLFGQIVIMSLFQIGGLGYMLFFTLIALLLGKELSMRNTLLLKESVKRPARIEAAKFAKLVIIFTVIVELAGAIALSLYLLHDYSLPQAVYSAVFHSISAFNTAGFSIYADSLSRYHSSLVLNGIVVLIFTAGSLGFWVVFDSLDNIRNKLKSRKPSRLSLHSRLVYLLTIAFFVVGTAVLFISEHSLSTASIKEKSITAAFQTLTATSTTGFNTVDIGAMSTASLFLMAIFMFVGAGPGSTAGGIKLTTFGVLLAFLVSVLRQKEDVNVFRRRLSADIIRHATAILFLAFLWTVLATLILSVTEQGTFMQILFEVVSAVGTVGLSTGITGDLTVTGKLVIIGTMLIGRIGPLGVGFSVLRRRQAKFQYPLGDIYIG